jgi:hypothetical protein
MEEYKWQNEEQAADSCIVSNAKLSNYVQIHYGILYITSINVPEDEENLNFFKEDCKKLDKLTQDCVKSLKVLGENSYEKHSEYEKRVEGINEVVEKLNSLRKKLYRVNNLDSIKEIYQAYWDTSIRINSLAAASFVRIQYDMVGEDLRDFYNILLLNTIQNLKDGNERIVEIKNPRTIALLEHTILKNLEEYGSLSGGFEKRNEPSYISDGGDISGYDGFLIGFDVYLNKRKPLVEALEKNLKENKKICRSRLVIYSLI